MDPFSNSKKANFNPPKKADWKGIEGLKFEAHLSKLKITEMPLICFLSFSYATKQVSWVFFIK
jgi:hypothetical protein